MSTCRLQDGYKRVKEATSEFKFLRGKRQSWQTDVKTVTVQAGVKGLDGFRWHCRGKPGCLMIESGSKGEVQGRRCQRGHAMKWTSTRADSGNSNWSSAVGTELNWTPGTQELSICRTNSEKSDDWLVEMTGCCTLPWSVFYFKSGMILMHPCILLVPV